MARSGLAAFVILFGVGFGVFSPARAGLVADRFDTAIFGRVNGQARAGDHTGARGWPDAGRGAAAPGDGIHHDILAAGGAGHRGRGAALAASDTPTAWGIEHYTGVGVMS